MRIKVTCPYCEHEQPVEAQLTLWERRLVTCGLEEGGCDRDFVVTVKLCIKSSVAAVVGEMERVS